MVTRPRISLFGSAHRPQNWLDLYRSIGQNAVEFEIVFVGPREPNFELPDNFRFIQSHVKPTQCLESAARNAQADLIMNVADDCVFRTPRALDRLYAAYRSHGNDSLILSCRYMLNGEDRSSQHHFFVHDESSPIMPLCGLMSKSLYKSIGGVDRNFIAVMWDLDVAMRVWAQGGEVALSDVYADELKARSAGSELCKEFWAHDRGLLESLWCANGRVHFDRARAVEPFSNHRILEVSQGPRGRWRGSSPLVVEKLVDSWRWRRRKLGRAWARNGPALARFLRRVCHAIGRPTRYPDYARRLLRSSVLRRGGS